MRLWRDVGEAVTEAMRWQVWLDLGRWRIVTTSDGYKWVRP